jgi:3D (Asp-Asp-Asp) domain-containing protein
MRRALTALLTVAAAAALAAAPKNPPTHRAAPHPGAVLTVSATAYCDAGKTRSGLHTRRGIVAADPKVLPVGSTIRIIAPGERYDGIYTVMDTGGAINGRELDIFMTDCERAVRFGRRDVRVRVLRRGWDPKASAKGSPPPN